MEVDGVDHGDLSQSVEVIEWTRKFCADIERREYAAVAAT